MHHLPNFPTKNENWFRVLNPYHLILNIEKNQNYKEKHNYKIKTYNFNHSGSG